MTVDSTTLPLAVAARAGCPEQGPPPALTDLRVAGHPMGMYGNPARIGEVYRRHAPSVYRRALHILGSEGEARALLEALFVALFERTEPLPGARSLSGHLYGATTHACLARLRAQRARASARDADLSVVPAGSKRAALGVLRGTLARLPEPLAVVAVYSVLDGLDTAEMAELLGCSQRQVGQLLARLEAWGQAASEPACAIE